MTIKWQYNEWKTNVYTPRIDREKAIIEVMRVIAEELRDIKNILREKKGDSIRNQ